MIESAVRGREGGSGTLSAGSFPFLDVRGRSSADSIAPVFGAGPRPLGIGSVVHERCPWTRTIDWWSSTHLHATGSARIQHGPSATRGNR